MDEHKLDFADGDVFYQPNWVDEEVATRWYKELRELETWYQPKLKVYGKTVTQSRHIAAYASDPDLVVKYSGSTVDMHFDYPPTLKAIQEQVEERLGVKFNHVMLNLYEDGGVYIGNHRDNRENRVIASLSLGAERTFVMTHDSVTKKKVAATNERYRKKWTLGNGSLVVMQGETQKSWKHEIPK
ncbi:alpha-ketoglutarate-dependent dioxygenase alkB-like protein [Pseudohyphozyma bogoriensis]|nr:alpha-ketoglutarate-dependent dioxygenase alkB-like protein [Pseudohyphozyma bogoriensis]